MTLPALDELSYEAGIRALDLQERGVEQLRSRTGVLLAASSLTASFLGGQTVSRTSALGSLVTLALLSLAASIGLSVYVLLPKSGFVFSLSGTRMLDELSGVDDEHRGAPPAHLLARGILGVEPGEDRRTLALLPLCGARARPTARFLVPGLGGYDLLRCPSSRRSPPLRPLRLRLPRASGTPRPLAASGGSRAEGIRTRRSGAMSTLDSTVYARARQPRRVVERPPPPLISPLPAAAASRHADETRDCTQPRPSRPARLAPRLLARSFPCCTTPSAPLPSSLLLQTFPLDPFPCPSNDTPRPTPQLCFGA